MEIVGYTHSDGYVLCEEHAVSPVLQVPFSDDGNESGEVQPIFDESAWDYFPPCEECGIPLDVCLTSDGFKYYHEHGFTGTNSYDIYCQVLDVWHHNNEGKI